MSTTPTTTTAPRRIAIFRALFLGDLLMSAPAWRALRARFPDAEISLIGLPWAAQLLAHMPGLIDRLVPFEGYQGINEVPASAEHTARFLGEQRAQRYDLAIQMHGDGSVSNGFVQALGAKATLGFALPGDTRLSTCLPHHDDQNEIWRWLRLVAAAGAPSNDARISFALNSADVERVRATLGHPDGERPLVGLHVGAKDPARRWPATRFAALGQELRRRTGARFVLTGGADERPAVTVVRRFVGAPVTDLCGRTSLGEFAAALAELDLLITNDTGASHLAAALGVPSVVIFGPTRPIRFAPLNGALHRVVDAVEHAPSHYDAEHALRALPVAPVLRAALEQLAARRPQPAAAALAAHALGR